MGKHKKAKFIYATVIIIAVFAFSSYLVDSNRIKNGNNSIFSIPIMSYKDGGTVYRLGLCYGVYEWKRLSTKVINNVNVDGENTGTEVVLFPRSVLVIFDNSIEPKIELRFEPMK